MLDLVALRVVEAVVGLLVVVDSNVVVVIVIGVVMLSAVLISRCTACRTSYGFNFMFSALFVSSTAFGISIS